MKSNSLSLLRSVTIALIVSATNSHSLTITSSQLNASGEWEEEWVTESGGNIEQHRTSGSGNKTGESLYGSFELVSEPHGWNWAEANFGVFSLEIQADAEAWGPVFLARETITGGGMGFSASSISMFRPQSTHLMATVAVDSFWNYSADEQNLRVTLTDLNTSAILVDLENLDDDSGSLETFALSVDPLHLYELRIFGWVDAFDLKNLNMSARVTFDQPVHVELPDQGTTAVPLLLALSSLYMLHEHRRHSWEAALFTREKLQHEGGFFVTLLIVVRTEDQACARRCVSGASWSPELGGVLDRSERKNWSTKPNAIFSRGDFVGRGSALFRAADAGTA